MYIVGKLVILSVHVTYLQLHTAILQHLKCDLNSKVIRIKAIETRRILSARDVWVFLFLQMCLFTSKLHTHRIEGRTAVLKFINIMRN